MARHFAVVLLLVGILVSCQTLPKERAYVGRWWGQEDGVTGTLELNSDHTCTFILEGITTEGTWSVTDGQLAVMIRPGKFPDGRSYSGEEFYGSLSPDGDKLSFWEEGSEVTILTKVN